MGERITGNCTGIFALSFETSMLKICNLIKVRLSPSKKICVIYLIESPLKMMKSAFYFIFSFSRLKFLSQLFGHVGKMA